MVHKVKLEPAHYPSAHMREASSPMSYCEGSFNLVHPGQPSAAEEASVQTTVYLVCALSTAHRPFAGAMYVAHPRALALTMSTSLETAGLVLVSRPFFFQTSPSSRFRQPSFTSEPGYVACATAGGRSVGTTHPNPPFPAPHTHAPGEHQFASPLQSGTPTHHTPHRTIARCTAPDSTVLYSAADHTTPHHTTPHHTTPHHTTPHHTTPHHTTPHHTTPHHTLSTPQLYSRAGCRVRSPRRQGPGTANRRCTNSVGCAHVPVPSTIPRDPAAPSTGRLGPGNGQRPSIEDG